MHGINVIASIFQNTDSLVKEKSISNKYYFLTAETT